ncbi:MAG: TauD/TfdA family dioxygenase [Gammaproteobacteria bacterium]|nr:TauD/TfdA family dioxygenase [Gammaproteobacteria bacterium]
MSETLFQMRYENFNLKPLSGALGASIEGVNLTALDKDTLEEIAHAFATYHLLLFRDQFLTLDNLVTLGSHFGNLLSLPPGETLDEYPSLLCVQDAKESAPYYLCNQWSSDMSFLHSPPHYSLSYCSDTQGFGGESVFATQSLAYESLSHTTQAILSNLKAMHSNPMPTIAKDTSAKTEDSATIQPVVRTLEDTGVKAIYVNPTFTREIHGMKEAESQMLLSFLYDHVTQESFTCRFTWEKDTLAIWDNRCLQHLNLVNDAMGKRTLYKAMIQGIKPY